MDRLWPAGLESLESKPPFFWVHGDTTNTVLRRCLGPDQPIYAIEHQSLDGQRARYTEVETIAEHYLRQVRDVRPYGPYLLGGYSFGAAVAFEMAQQLQKSGEHVLGLFMLDPPGKKRKGQLSVTNKPSHLLPRLLSRIEANIRSLSMSVQRLRWKACLAAGSLVPPSLRSKYILDIYRDAIRIYTPQPYSGPVTLFKTEGDSYQPRLDWIKLVTGDIEIYEEVAAHLELRQERYIRVWAACLKHLLDRTQQAVGAGI